MQAGDVKWVTRFVQDSGRTIQRDSEGSLQIMFSSALRDMHVKYYIGLYMHHIRVPMQTIKSDGGVCDPKLEGTISYLIIVVLR